MRCKLAAVCKHYKTDSYTCNSGDEANSYCGSYRQFKNQNINLRIITI